MATLRLRRSHRTDDNVDDCLDETFNDINTSQVERLESYGSISETKIEKVKHIP